MFVLMAIAHHTIVTLLALAGIALMLGVTWTVNAPPAAEKAVPELYAACDTLAGLQVYLCTALSPDMTYRCEGKIAHNGWCHHGGLEWRDDVWAVGSEDRTAMPPQSNGSEAATTALRLRQRMPRPALWAAIIFMAAVNSHELSMLRGVS